jgi:NAD(P)-dependent dehydrogenase (short-subunit alcohol dehydrogenase family)
LIRSLTSYLRDLALFDEELHFMVTATLGVIRSFLPLIRQGQEKKILVVTSVLGSIDQSVNLPGLDDSYSVARASLNMLIRKWGGVLKSEGITTAVIHPGMEAGSDLIERVANSS